VPDDIIIGQKYQRRNVSVIVFVPSQTRDGVPLDHEFWRDEAITVMARLFGGATVIGGYGAWLDDERDNVLREDISVVLSFAAEGDWNETALNTVKGFLRRMGREGKQGEVGLAVNGEYFGLRSFDEEDANG
jgi:hypothetical protein